MPEPTLNAMLTELDRRNALPKDLRDTYRQGLRTGQFHDFTVRTQDVQNSMILGLDQSTMGEAQAEGAALAYLESIGGYKNSQQFFGKELKGHELLGAVKGVVDPVAKEERLKTPMEKFNALSEDQQYQEALKLDSVKNEWVVNAAKFKTDLENPNPVVKESIIDMGRREAFQRSYTDQRRFMEDIIKQDAGAWAMHLEALETGYLPEEGAIEYLDPEVRQALFSVHRLARPFDAQEGFFGTASEATIRLAQAARDIPEGFVKGFAGLGRQASIGLYSLGSIDGAQELNKAMARERKLAREFDMAMDLKLPERSRVGKAVVGLAETLPFMVSVGTLGPAGMLAAGASVKHRVEGQLEDQGFTPEEAGIAGIAAGATAVYVERLMGFAGKTKIAGHIAKPLIAREMSKSLLKSMANIGARAGERGLKMWAEETLEEGIESGLNSVWQQLVKGDVPDRKKVFEEFKQGMAEASDVTALMALFGAGGRAVTDVRTGEETLHSIERLDKGLAILSDREISEGVESLTIDTVRAWGNAKTKAEGVAALKEAGWTDTAIKEFEQELNDKATDILDIDTQRNEEIDALNKKRDGRSERSTEIQRLAEEQVAEFPVGKDVVVEMAEQMDDPSSISEMDGNVLRMAAGIEVGAIDNAVRHELMHRVTDLGLTVEEQAWVDKREPEWRKTHEIDVLYSDKADGVKKLEAIAKAAEMPAYEQSVLRRVWQGVQDFRQAFRNVLSGMGFKSDKSVLDAILRKERTGTPKDAQEPLQARTRADDVFDAARIVAGHMWKNTPNLEQVVESQAKIVGVDKAQLMETAQAVYKIANNAITTDTNLEQAMHEIAKASIEEKWNQERRKIMQVGFEVGKQTAEARSRQQHKKKRHDKARVEKDRQGIMPETVERMSVSKVLDGDSSFDDWQASIEKAVDDNMKAKKLKGKAVRDAELKKEMKHQLWPLLKRMKHSDARGALKTKLDLMAISSRRINTSWNDARSIISRVAGIDYKQDLDAAKSDFRKLLNAEAGLKMSQFGLAKDRKITQERHDELNIAKDVVNMEPGKLAKLERAILHAQEQMQQSTSQEMDDHVDDLIAGIENDMPTLSKPKFKHLDNYQKLNTAAGVVSKYGGVLQSNSTAIIAEATDQLILDIGTDQAELLRVANEQTDMFERNKSTAKKAFKSDGRTAGPLANFFTGTFNIKQRMRHMARLGGSVKAGEQLAKDLQIQQAADDHLGIMDEKNVKFMNAVKEAYNKVAYLAIRDLTGTHKEYKKFNKKNKAELSKQNLMQLWATWQQADGRKDMESMEYTERDIELIAKEFTDGDWMLIDWMRNEYALWGDEKNEVSLRNNGMRVASDDVNYFPIVRDVSKTYNSVEVRNSPIFPPSLNPRSGSVGPIDPEAGIIQTFMGRLEEHAHYVSHADGAIQTHRLFSNRNLTSEMENIHGEKVWGDFIDHMQDIYSNNRIPGYRSKLWRNVASVYTIRSLAWNLGVTAKQFSSVFAYAMPYGTAKGIGMVASAATSGDYIQAFKKLRESKQWKARARLGMDDLMSEALRSEFGTSDIDRIVADGKGRDIMKAVFDSLKFAYKTGMVTTRVGDLTPIALLGPAVYLHELKQADGNEELAMSQTWSVIQSTQQSSLAKDRNKLARRGDDLKSVVGMFLSTPGQYFAFVSEALHDLANNPKDTKKWKRAADVVGVHIALSGAYVLIGAAFRAALDDEDEVKDLLADEELRMKLVVDTMANTLSSQFLLGAMWESGLESAYQGRPAFGKNIVPIEGFVDDFSSLGALMHHGFTRDHDEMLESVKDLADNWLAPARHARELIEE